MSVDVETGPAVRPAAWLTIRLAATMIAGGGKLPADDALTVAEQTLAEQPPSRRRRTPRQRMNDALKPLRDDGVIVLVDGVWYVPDVVDLAAWMADAVEEREEAGLLRNPVIPQARSAA